MNCYNVSAEDGNVTVDLLYYKGYRAFDADTGEELAVYAGSNGLVTVNVPTGYDGIVEISFVSPWYWRMAEIISCISVVGMFVLYQRDKKRMLMQKEA